jgi:hypothetical protein
VRWGLELEYLKDRRWTESTPPRDQRGPTSCCPRMGASHLFSDVLVSWNFKHIVNLDRIHRYNSVNLREGYALLEIRSPQEVLQDESEGQEV